MPSVWRPFWVSSLQITGTVLANATISAYLVATSGYASRKMAEFVDMLVADGVLPAEAGSRRKSELAGVPRTGSWVAAIVGILLSVMNLPSLEYLLGSFAGPTPVLDLSIVVGSVVLWSIIAQVGFRGIRSALIFSDMGGEDVEVDLLRVSRLTPIGQAGTLYILLVIGALSLMPIQALDAELRWFNYFNGFIVGLPIGTVLFLVPMLGVRRKVRKAKSIELERLDRAILATDRDLEAAPLSQLNDLLEMRERIVRIRDWPMDMTIYRRIGLYGIIPPIAWAGAALVEILLTSALG